MTAVCAWPKVPRKLTTVWVYYAAASDVSMAATDTLVTDDDRERLAALTHPRRRAEYLRGRALLRFALERRTGLSARAHRIVSQPSGKPRCVGGPAISISHDRTLLACAIASEGDVGIDVQAGMPGRSVEGIAHNYFSAVERERLHGASTDSFYMLWVLKEAYLKCLGCGLAGGLDLLECRVEPPSIEVRAVAPVHLALYSADAAFIGVAVTGGDALDIRVERWAPSSAVPLSLPIRLVAKTASA